MRLGLLMLAAAGAAAAADPPQSRDVEIGVVPEEVWTAEGFDPAESAGLFVGIRDFADKTDFAEVPFAADDAVDLAHLFALELGLIAPSKVVLILAGEPQKEDSGRRLRELLAKGAVRSEKEAAGATGILRGLVSQAAAAGPRGLFVVALATHGFSVERGDFVVAADSLKTLITDTGVRLGAVFDSVERSAAPRRLVFLDACRERFARSLAGDPAAAMSRSFADEIGRARGQVVLAGAAPGGFAYDDPERKNGVFTAAVIDGLQGQAPADERSYVTAATLAEFVNARVLAWVEKHRPEHVGRTVGIERRIAGDAARLPLAVDVRRRQDAAEFELRSQEALTLLFKNVGPPGPIDKAMSLAVAEILLGADPSAPNRRLLDEFLTEIEILDGTKVTQQSFAFYFGRNRTRLAAGEVGPSRGAVGEGSRTATPELPPPGRREKEIASDRCGTHSVGQKLANDWNLRDMLGNVWEWVWDSKAAYPSGPTVDPVADRGAPACSAAGVGATTPAAAARRIAARNRRDIAGATWGVVS